MKNFYNPETHQLDIAGYAAMVSGFTTEHKFKQGFIRHEDPGFFGAKVPNFVQCENAEILRHPEAVEHFNCGEFGSITVTKMLWTALMDTDRTGETIDELTDGVKHIVNPGNRLFWYAGFVSADFDGPFKFENHGDMYLNPEWNEQRTEPYNSKTSLLMRSPLNFGTLGVRVFDKASNARVYFIELGSDGWEGTLVVIVSTINEYNTL